MPELENCKDERPRRSYVSYAPEGAPYGVPASAGKARFVFDSAMY